MRPSSITQRLMLTVLLLEFFAAITLVVLVTNHERHVQFENLDANLRATANALLGSVQEADTKDGSVRLDLNGITFPAHAVYSVSADDKQILGARGTVPPFPNASGAMTKIWVDKHPYRFYALKGERIIDPGSPDAINHQVTVLYGVPEGNTWHEVFEATRYFSVATTVLLGITALVMTFLIRRFLAPIHELALSAEAIDAEQWEFQAPESSQQSEELAPLASAIEKTISRLHRSFEQQRRFTSDAAHELKTDLAIVKSSIQLLCLKRRTIEEYEQGLALSLTDIGRLEETVYTMLTLARLEHASSDPKEVCDLVEALRDSIHQSSSFALMKNIQVVLQAPTTPAQVLISDKDASLLFSNIVMNALQHSPNGSVVAIELTCGTTSVQVQVRDQGPGVLDADLPYLFDAFYRGDASRSRKSGGTGLGLSICNAICYRANGQISIRNHPDGGAEVKVVLPRVNLSAT